MSFLFEKTGALVLLPLPLALWTAADQMSCCYLGPCLQALFGTLTPDVMVLTVLYSIAGLGIAIVNDFKSIDGDRWAVALIS